MKLAFIHAMRTGGTYAGSVFKKSGGRMHCNWHAGLGRDLLRSELMAASARERDGMIHNHLVNWDAELVAWCKQYDWRTFTILRDPCDQLVSLWHYCGGDDKPPLDEFLAIQSAGGACMNLDFHHWAAPAWWREIDVLVPFGEDLGKQLHELIGLPLRQDLPALNARERSAFASSGALEMVRRSDYYKRFLDADEASG